MEGLEPRLQRDGTERPLARASVAYMKKHLIKSGSLNRAARLRRVRSSDGGLGRPRRRTAVLLNRDNVHSRKRHAAVIIKPNYNPAPARVNTRVIRTGNRIAVTATGHDGKRLKRGCGKMLAYVGGHKINLVN